MGIDKMSIAANYHNQAVQATQINKVNVQTSSDTAAKEMTADSKVSTASTVQITNTQKSGTDNGESNLAQQNEKKEEYRNCSRIIFGACMFCCGMRRRKEDGSRDQSGYTSGRSSISIKRKSGTVIYYQCAGNFYTRSKSKRDLQKTGETDERTY